MSPNRGRGVFTREFIPSRALIHISPVLILKGNDKDLSQQGILTNYTYNWFDSQQQALALGLGSMFNHSQKHNVGFIKDKNNTVIRYYTLQNVDAHEELFINYGPHLWFNIENENCDQKYQEHSTNRNGNSDGGNCSGSGSDDDDNNPFSRLEL